MRVLLLKPPVYRKKALFSRSPGKWLFPLRMAYLVSGLKSMECVPEFLDCPREGFDDPAAAGSILLFHPDVVYAELDKQCAAKQLAFLSQLKRAGTARIVLGGTYAAFFHELICSGHPFVDAVIRGETDTVFFNLISCWKNGYKIDYTPEVSVPGARKPLVGPAGPPRYDLDNIPFPDRETIPFLSYQKGCLHRHPFALVAGSRGCPQTCSFCHLGHSKRRIRFRSPDNIAEETEQLVRNHRVNEFRMVDSVFNADPGWSCRTADLLSPLTTQWHCSCTAANLDNSILREYRRAGCLDIFFTAVCPTEESRERLSVWDGPEAMKKILPLALQEDIRLHIRILSGPAPLPSFEEAQWFATSLSNVDVRIRYIHPHLDAPSQNIKPETFITPPENHNMQFYSGRSKKPLMFLKKRYSRIFKQPVQEICAEDEPVLG